MPNVFSEKSRQNWQYGNECLAQGKVNAAANRIYYSVFQAVKGAAIERQQMKLTDRDGVHTTALRIVGMESSRGAKFRRQLSLLLSMRLVADYEEEDVDAERLKDLLRDAEAIRSYYIKIVGGQL